MRRQLDVSNPFTLGLLHALVPAATHHDRRVLVFTHDEDRTEEFRTTASAGLVDGFVLSDSTAGDERAQVLDELGVPFVVMGRPETGSPVAALDIDNALAMHDAVDHVVGRGCRDVAYVGYSGPAHWNVERRRGVREALTGNGLALPRHRILTGRSLKKIRGRLPEFLTHHGVPDAVVTSSDSIAVSVIAVAHMLGMRVGKEIAVTGFDDTPLASMVSPEITSIALPVEPIAEQLLTMLDDVLQGRTPDPPAPVRTRLVVRGSSGFTATGGR